MSRPGEETEKGDDAEADADDIRPETVSDSALLEPGGYTPSEAESIEILSAKVPRHPVFT